MSLCRPCSDSIHIGAGDQSSKHATHSHEARSLQAPGTTVFTKVRSGRGTRKTERQDRAHQAIPILCVQVKAHCLTFYFGHVTVIQQHICLFPRAISFPPTGWKTRCWVKLEQNREIVCLSPFWDGASCACLGSSQRREHLRKYHICTKISCLLRETQGINTRLSVCSL